MKINLRAVFLVTCFCLGAVSNARAWNPTGHMIIASMTYDLLSSETRARWADLLKQHPAFSKWKSEKPANQPGFDENRYLFMRASTWPDDVRKTGSPFDHPSWHHIDYPLEAPDFADRPPPADAEDALFAVKHCESMLRDSQAAASEQAASLSWLIHVVSDLQQPLHCATFIDPDGPAPEGDRNGLARVVVVGGAPISLHWFWDCLPGTTLDEREIVERSRQLAERFPREALPELARATDPQAWSLEGRALCLDAVYRRGSVRGAKESGPDAPTLPEGYAAAAHAVADRRVALAAWRLAAELGKLGHGQ